MDSNTLAFATIPFANLRTSKNRNTSISYSSSSKRCRTLSPSPTPPMPIFMSISMSTSPHHNDVILPNASTSAPLAYPQYHPVAEEDKLLLELDSGAGAGGAWAGGGGWSRGDDSDGSGSGGDDYDYDYEYGKAPDEALSSLLRKNNAVITDVPSDILRAYSKGFIELSAIANFLHAKSNVFSRVLMSCGSGMRSRFMADKLLLLKIGIEEAIGIFGKLSAEYDQRRARFWSEMPFVLSNLASALAADFMLVVVPAPTVRLTGTCDISGSSNMIAKFCSRFPTSIFQRDPMNSFTLAQRFAGFGVKAVQLFGVGFACSLGSILVTNSIISLKERFDVNYKSETEKQNALFVPLLYGTFLAVSSNTRYQLVNGVEGRIFPVLFGNAPKLIEEAATFAIRYANTFWGSSQWCIFTKLTGAQKMKAQEA